MAEFQYRDGSWSGFREMVDCINEGLFEKEHLENVRLVCIGTPAEIDDYKEMNSRMKRIEKMLDRLIWERDYPFFIGNMMITDRMPGEVIMPEPDPLYVVLRHALERDTDGD